MAYHEHLRRLAPDYKLAASEAARVLRENFVDSPPVLPRELARNYGYRVYFADFPREKQNVSGFLNFNERAIYVNRDDSPGRQTFTIAHELGHGIMHTDLIRRYPSDYQVLYRAPIGSVRDPLEQEANAFAANLLVPREMLEKFRYHASVAELARLFIVSEDVIRYRLQNEYA